MIEEIIYSNKDDFEIISALKQEIKKYTHNLEQEAQGKQFFVKYTKKMDEFITVVFKLVLKKVFGYYRPNINSLPITLTAMGSYGRIQLSLQSDIDIMIVYKEIAGYNIKSIIENFVTMLWDLGLKIGHRVHCVDELFAVSQQDVMIKTAILESRYIFGSKHLWVEIENELKKIRLDNQKDFVLQRYQKMQEYHKKYPLSMEPNIKKGFGGMRDANTLYWIANVLYGIKNNAELVGIVYDEKMYREYRNALEFIFRVRTFLHIIAKSSKDTVLLEYQREIALKMGYVDTQRLQAQRQFIRDLLRSLWTINRFASIYIKKFLKKFLYNPQTISKIKRIAKGYYVCDDKIYINWNNTDDAKESLKVLLNCDFRLYDVSLVNLFYHQTINFTKSQIKEMFHKTHLYPIIKALYKANKLHAVIPAFEKVLYLAQFDGYHQYPVDIHSIKTLYNVENIRFPIIKQKYDKLDKTSKQILKIVALFHDLGKGRTADHHIVGEKLVGEFMSDLGFKLDKVSLAKRLVRYHTTMSEVAQREDIDNDKTLLKFANIVQDKLTLDMLYILTYADMDAVSDNLFNSFKENLLTTLYNNTLEVLDNQQLRLLCNKRQRKEKQLLKNEEFLSLPKSWQKKVLNSPSTQLFLKNNHQQIAQIAKKMYQLHTSSQKFAVDITPHPLTIEIIKKEINFDLGYLLYKLSSFALYHISIYKVDEVKYFRIEFDSQDVDMWSLQEIINQSFASDNKFRFDGIDKYEIEIDCNHSKNYLAFNVKTTNKNAIIIAMIMHIMDRYKIDVEDIKISVHRHTLRCMMIINKYSNFCNIKDEVVAEIGRLHQ
ncbi:MAG: HD domain-containing protein [Epsilonproteobacteria bacterium]|nr:HD domain-containing protein [Campylobacterota bacterium]